MDSQELLLPQHYSTRNKTNTSDGVTPPQIKKAYFPNLQRGSTPMDYSFGF